MYGMRRFVLARVEDVAGTTEKCIGSTDIEAVHFSVVSEQLPE
jgi:hypothetical protein